MEIILTKKYVKINSGWTFHFKVQLLVGLIFDQ